MSISKRPRNCGWSSLSRRLRTESSTSQTEPTQKDKEVATRQFGASNVEALCFSRGKLDFNPAEEAQTQRLRHPAKARGSSDAEVNLAARRFKRKREDQTQATYATIAFLG